MEDDLKKDIEKVKEREEKRWEQYDNSHDADGKPINDVMDYLGKIEGYPTGKPVKMSKLPLPVRVIGYILMTFLGIVLIGFIVVQFI